MLPAGISRLLRSMVLISSSLEICTPPAHRVDDRFQQFLPMTAQLRLEHIGNGFDVVAQLDDQVVEHALGHVIADQVDLDDGKVLGEFSWTNGSSAVLGSSTLARSTASRTSISAWSRS